jgi:hypothetical protein
VERAKNNLDQIRVASPCKMAWERMEGDEQVRFCHRCKLNVYNLSAMSREEAENLVQEREGRLCVRFYRRPDGTLLTRNCPVGKQEARSKWILAGVLGGLLTIAMGFRHSLAEQDWMQKLRYSRLGQATPIRQAMDILYPEPAQGEVLGMVAPPKGVSKP